MARSPKDTFITVYGRKPVLEALDDADLHVDKVVLADDARGEPVRAILAAAKARGVPVQRASAHRVKVLAGNGRHDQGVLADVVAPRMQAVDEFLLDLGNETDGLSAAVRAECDATLAIPMEGGVESLNVACAGAVAAFELRRRRR